MFSGRSSTLEGALREALKKDNKELVLSVQKFVSQPGKRLSDEAIDEHVRIIDSLTFESIIFYHSKGERPVSNVKQSMESVVTYLVQNYSVCSIPPRR